MSDVTHACLLQAVERLAVVRNIEQPLVFTICPIGWIARAVVTVAQIDAPAALLRDVGRQRRLDAWRLLPRCGVVGSRALDVRAVREDATSIRTALLRLPKELVCALRDWLRLV